MYYSTLKDEPLKEAIVEDPPIIERNTKYYKENPHKRTFKQKIARGIYIFTKRMYATYFYFIPLTTFFYEYFDKIEND